MAKRARIEVEKPKNSYVKHGGRNTRLYEIWGSMIGRCRYKGHTSYPYYGAKGISVCDSWDSFVPFRDWALTNGYKDDLSIDRINGLGNYEPTNCRWVTRSVQMENRHFNLNELTIFNETKPFVKWLSDSRCNLSYSALWGRISRGWELEKALTTPLGRGNRAKT